MAVKSSAAFPWLTPGEQVGEEARRYAVGWNILYYDAGDEVDLITDIKTDAEGQVLSISKPLINGAAMKKLVEKMDGDSGVIYRFKLKESAVTPSTLGENKFQEDTDEKIVDVFFTQTIGFYKGEWCDNIMEPTFNVFDSVKQAERYYEKNYPMCLFCLFCW